MSTVADIPKTSVKRSMLAIRDLVRDMVLVGWVGGYVRECLVLAMGVVLKWFVVAVVYATLLVRTTNND